MELLIETPDFRSSERDYILGVLLGEFLGLPWRRISSDRLDIRITLPGSKGVLRLPEKLFAFPDDKWLSSKSFPSQPLASFNCSELELPLSLTDICLPIIYGDSGKRVSKCNHAIYLPIDIFGSAFFMLSRYEELVKPDRDEHKRFPAAASLAYKEKFLYRPIIDEYVELLWTCMIYLWPRLERKSRRTELFVTCDVDRPYDSSVCTLKKAVKRIGGDIIKRCSPSMALQSARRAVAWSRGDWSLDPYNTFDWMMDTCEKAGRKMAFYILSQDTSDNDTRYDLNEDYLKQLIKKIHERNHEIGLHTSYNSYCDRDRIKQERTALIRACRLRGIGQEIKGNRQHYLRWDVSQTPDHLDAAGFEYDTTGSFADAPGFRYGTSQPFTLWSWGRKSSLKIKERPLVVMERSVIDKNYLGLGYTDESLDMMNVLKNRAMQFGGDFTLLWHNSHLLTSKDKEFYKMLIR